MGINWYDPKLREREGGKERNNDEQETDKSLTIYEGIIALNHEVVEREAKETVDCSSFVNLSFTKLRD